MTRVRILTTDEEIDAYLAESRDAPAVPAVRSADYLPGLRLLMLHLKSGQRLALPVEDIEELANATDEQLAHFEIEGGGLLVHFPDFDGNLDVSFIAEGGRGGDRWTEQLQAKRSAALQAAA